MTVPRSLTGILKQSRNRLFVERVGSWGKPRYCLSFEGAIIVLMKHIGLGVLMLVLLAGCGIPTDPRNTLDDVRRSGVVVVGASPAPPLVVLEGTTVTGGEAELAAGFAAHLDVRLRWVVGGEQHLVDQLGRGELQMIIGGITADTPWTSTTTPTRSYAESTDEDGRRHQHVMLVQSGENWFLSELERYLDHQTGKLR